jgi:exodeoxyribonuclease VII large subunit
MHYALEDHLYYTIDYLSIFHYNSPIMAGNNSMLGDHKQILTVSELTQQIKKHLEKGFEEVWLEGEISNFRSPSSGHYYFTLKDDTSQIRAVIFRFMGRYLKYQPEDGLHLICRGRISLYEPRGEYQIILDYMEPKGVGALQIAFDQLKEKLKKEGLFDPEHKRPLPFLPTTIGVVTSPTGAVIKDMINVIGRRFPNVALLINPVKVQGEGSSQEIATAIATLNRISGIDVIILARGGGSLEDLWSFNEEIVARAIYHSAIPVVSAVGHEIDFTIADFVADLRAPTPSAAAELVVRDKKELARLIVSLSGRLRNRIVQVIETEKQQSVFLHKRLPDLRLRLGDLHLRADDLKTRLAPRVLHLLRLRQEMLQGKRVRLLLRNPRLIIEDAFKRVTLSQKGLTNSIRLVFQQFRQRFETYAGALEGLSPLNVLKRGYSITHLLPSYQIVKESTVLSPGDRVNVILGKGDICCTVEKINE